MIENTDAEQVERLNARVIELLRENDRLRDVAGRTEMSDWYLVWSNEHRCWWRSNSQGYTKRISDAGRYSREEAIEISRGRGWPATGIPDEVPVREIDAVECFLKTAKRGDDSTDAS